MGRGRGTGVGTVFRRREGGMFRRGEGGVSQVQRQRRTHACLSPSRSVLGGKTQIINVKYLNLHSAKILLPLISQNDSKLPQSGSRLLHLLDNRLSGFA